MRGLRATYPRLYELKDSIANRKSPQAYFQNFDDSLANSAHVREVYLRWEQVLQELDFEAWAHLKTEVGPHLIQRDHSRGWYQLFDILGEARAYKYLKSIGCSGVRFIPRTSEKTPDLQATLDLGHLLCEVKTINPSSDEMTARNNPPTVRSLPIALTSQFLRKLSSKIDEAKGQLLAHDPQRVAEHFVYLNINFDDPFSEFKEQYFKQIDDHFLEMPLSDVRLIICNDHTPFYKRLRMRFAEVDNLD